MLKNETDHGLTETMNGKRCQELCAAMEKLLVGKPVMRDGKQAGVDTDYAEVLAFTCAAWRILHKSPVPDRVKITLILNLLSEFGEIAAVPDGMLKHVKHLTGDDDCASATRH